MILLADSGSTKTDWCVADGAAEICRIATHGTNPFFQSADEIAREVDGGLLPQLGNRPIEQIRFYGAGCAFPDKIAVIRDVLAARFTAADIEVGSDMLAAARALCGRNAGIACILGTGSNSCLYDGTEITANVSPLGFILGDEGSGAVLGRTLVGDWTQREISLAFRLDAGRYSRTDLQKTVPEPFSRRPVAVSRGKPRRTGNPDAGQKRFRELPAPERTAIPRLPRASRAFHRIGRLLL